MQVVHSDHPADDLLGDILGRDAALWIVEPDPLEGDALEAFSQLAGIPWRAVFVESASSVLAQMIHDSSRAVKWTTLTGFIHVLASDPTSIVFPRRSQPIFFLNGRDDRPNGAESSALATRSALRRRLNMVALLQDFEPKRLVILGRRPMAAVQELSELWESEFRSLLTIVTEDKASVSQVSELLARSTDLKSISWITSSPQEFSRTLFARANELDASSKVLARVQLPSGTMIDVDFMGAELPENPLLDACDLIQLRDTLPVSPQDLSEEEFRAFFTKSFSTWRPYAAGLPWIPNAAPERELLKALKETLLEPPETPRIFSVVSEPGAGGTTQVRALAFAAAKAGFPTILVKQQSEVPSSVELTSFLYRSVSNIANGIRHDDSSNEDLEPAWLLVLDVQHFDRSAEELWRLLADFTRSGRKIVILKVVTKESPLETPRNVVHRELIEVNHDLDQDSVASLGTHLNLYLRPHGKAKSVEEWMAFWKAHRPNMDTAIASFWIALEFWLAGFLQMGESIQSWVHSQFKGLDASPNVKRGILEITALSVERRALPERLLSPLVDPKLPWSQVLEDARRSSPGIGLIQAQAVPLGKVWALAHDVLARYLINAVWNDRGLDGAIGLAAAEDPVDLRLSLIAQVAGRTSFGDAFARPLAIALATNILKIDEQTGNPEFFRQWRKVLAVLDGVPEAVRTTSRLFNHHVAISRRRVTQGEIFQATPAEKRALLMRAVRDVHFALEKIESTQDDEPDLNLYNTLALLYQDLAALERSTLGDVGKIAEYLEKSDNATRRALRENPNNSYVLETAAKNLLRQNYDDESKKVGATAEALSFIYQASQLETATARTISLGKLAAEALNLLRSPEAGPIVEKLCREGNSFGYVARAWRIIAEGDDAAVDFIGRRIEPVKAAAALETLRESPRRDWLLVRLQYDLNVVASSTDFGQQLALLDELADIEGYRLSLQHRLERAVLLHQDGRHRQATNEFSLLRREVRAAGTILYVPDRLRWLMTPDRAKKAVCRAHVLDSSSGRPLAQVTELSRAAVPFIPQEFGKSFARIGELLACHVTFSAMGPFLKPAEG
ncbi:MAG: hypothetical protein WDZ63_13300 [Burkholderiales bacterium]